MTYLYSPCISFTPCNSVELSSFIILYKEKEGTQSFTEDQSFTEKSIVKSFMRK